MTADPAWIRDLFSGLGAITTRRMMGGLSAYADGRIFDAAGREGALYLRAKGSLAKELTAMGGKPFVVRRPDGTEGRMGYVTLPEAALDDPEAACDLARRALGEGSDAATGGGQLEDERRRGVAGRDRGPGRARRG